MRLPSSNDEIEARRQVQRIVVEPIFSFSMDVYRQSRQFAQASQTVSRAASKLAALLYHDVARDPLDSESAPRCIC